VQTFFATIERHGKVNCGLLADERMRSMESKVLKREDSWSDQTKLHIVGTAGISALVFAAIEFEFISTLIHLFGVHAKSDYIWPAIAFQTFLVASLVKYLLFWRRLREMPASAKEKEKIATDISSLVFFLLLSLFVCSIVAASFAKVS
jgi:hypothetical protein